MNRKTSFLALVLGISALIISCVDTSKHFSGHATQEGYRLIASAEVSNWDDLDTAFARYQADSPSLSATARCNGWREQKMEIKPGIVRICSWQKQLPQKASSKQLPTTTQPEMFSRNIVVLKTHLVQRGDYPAKVVWETNGASLQATFICNGWETRTWPPTKDPVVRAGDKIKICGPTSDY